MSSRTTPGGTTVKLPWAPTYDELTQRITTKWPDMVVVQREDEALYYADQHARDEWDQDGLTEWNRDLLVHALWTSDGVYIVVADSRSPIAKYILKWNKPVYVGDVFNVVDLDGNTLRTTTVIRVTSKSFQTDDGIKWAKVGKTPWNRFDLKVIAVAAD
jgi:hypothetical protein